MALTAVSLAALCSHDFRVENPSGAEVTKVHVVVGSHFDAGCKTPGCGELRHGEPNRCAATSMHWPNNPGAKGEPFAYHIVNRYLDEFLLRAAELGAQGPLPSGPGYSYVTQAWVLDLFLNCDGPTGIAAWPGSGSESGTPLLHCPNASSVSAVREAVARGHILLHAFPHDGEASYFPDASLFDAALALSARVAAQAGAPPPTAVSQRDVPGWTRAALPLLARRGINGLSFGAGTPPGKPDTPPIFVWRDEASGAEVVTTYETAYGTVSTVFVLPTGEALAAGWVGDNMGPPDRDTVDAMVRSLQQRFPQAEVDTSSFDAFFAAANRPDAKRRLPVVTAEIGDGWLYGTPSDPLKNAQLRELARQRLGCIEAGDCDPASPELIAFDRLLVKVPEHTWGVAQGWFLPDNVNWTNAQFDLARAQAAQGFVRNNSHHADYNTTQNSWLEQRTYVTAAPSLLGPKHAALAARMEAALAAIAAPAPHSTSGFAPVPPASFGRAFQCGGRAVAFDRHGRIARLGGWADAAHTLGGLLYQTYVNEDYNTYLRDFASRLGDHGDWPNHTAPRSGCWYAAGAEDDLNCGNFRKPNVSSARPVRRQLLPSLRALAHRADADGGCTFVATAGFAAEAVRDAGAPGTVSMRVRVGKGRIEWELIIGDKRPTRLPESLMFSLVPPVARRGWTARVLNSTVDPTDVLGKLGSSVETSVYGGSPHLRGVEAVSWRGREGELTMTSLDVPIVCFGEPSPFPTPRTGPPDMEKGVHFNVLNNIWNTNYVLWYPFVAEDERNGLRARFDLTISDHQYQSIE